MPQLDVSTFISQIFWLSIAFGLLYFVMAKFSIPVVASVRQSRQEKIAADLDRAESMRQEAETIEHEYRQSVEQTGAEAADIISEAATQTSEESKKRYSELDDTLEKKLSEANENIMALKEKAVAEIASVSADLSQQVIKKIAGLNVTQKQAVETVNILMNDKK